LQVLNTALMTAASGYSLNDARADREFWGRLVVRCGRTSGQRSDARRMHPALLARTQPRSGFHRVRKPTATAIEVKSGRAPQAHAGTATFALVFKP
jgi:hypothetical protein